MTDVAPAVLAMSAAPLRGLRIAVAGAGAFGLCAALACARSGAQVALYDPAPLGANASGMAAGMIAPLGELLYDDLGDELWPLLAAARAAWRPLEAAVPGLVLNRRGCVYGFEDGAAAAAAAARAQRLGVDAALSGGGAAFGTGFDWWLEPGATLRVLADAFQAAGGRLVPEALPQHAPARFDRVLLCPGPGAAALAPLAPVLARLRPIKGHLVRFQGAEAAAPLERRPGIYLAPQGGALIAGATMEPGRDDTALDQAILAELRARALAVRPELAARPWRGAAGVRMATPDRLPLAGPESDPKILVAAGARRNGWLFGPLVAEILLAYLTDRPVSAAGARLAPERFSGPAGFGRGDPGATEGPARA